MPSIVRYVNAVKFVRQDIYLSLICQKINLQKLTKYLRQTSDFMCSGALQEKFTFFFSVIFC